MLFGVGANTIRVPREETIFKDDMFEWRAYRAICRDDYSLLGALRPLKKKKGENTPDSAIDGGVSDDQTLLEKALYRKHVLVCLRIYWCSNCF